MTQEQIDFLNKHIKRTANDIWKERLVKIKGITFKKSDNLEESADEWELIDIKVGPEGTRPYKCECGKKLRYQYIVSHKIKQMTLKLGSQCIKTYTGIDANLMKRVLLEKEELNSNLDEILNKMDTNELESQFFLLDYESIPSVERKQLSLGIPLCEKQLNKILNNFDLSDKKRIKKTVSSLRELNDEQLEFINKLDTNDRQTLIVTLVDGTNIYNYKELNDLDLSLVANRKVELGLPLSISDVIKKNTTRRDSKEINKIKLAAEKLNKAQRAFWATNLSLNQRKELAVHILENTNLISFNDVEGKITDKKILMQIRLGLPLTNNQINFINLKTKQQISLW